jgi:hypothetical protein
LAFFIALLNYDIRNHEYQNALYSELAILEIGVEYEWQMPQVYTPVLSAVITVNRILVLYKAKRERKDEIWIWQEVNSENAQIAQRKARSHFHQVKEIMQRFMIIISYDGNLSLMDSILRLRSYGMAIAVNTNAKRMINWHKNELLYDYVQFNMALLRTMVHEIMYAARMQLLRKMLLLDVNDEGQGAAEATAIPFIRWNRLMNNVGERRTGWHFVNDPRNQKAFGYVDEGIWLAKRVHQKARLR